MSTIHIQLMTGPGRGRSADFDSSPITFGRDADNTLIVADEVVSRRHGEIRLEGKTWVLVNLSSNGTRVGKKRVMDKPCELANGDVVSVDDHPVFKVAIELSAEELEKIRDPGKPDPTKIKKQPISRRVKMWITIGGGWAIILGMVVFVQTCTFKPPGLNGSGPRAVLTHEDIEKSIRENIPNDVPNEIAGQSWLERARTAAGASRSNPMQLYVAYDAYKHSLVCFNARSFKDPLDQLQFQKVEKDLIEAVWDRYSKGIGERNFPAQAEKDFDMVTKLYNDSQSLIFKNADAFRREALQKLKH